MVINKLKKYAYIILIASVLINVLAFAVVLPSFNAFNFETDYEATVQVRVLDGLTNAPIEGATVCIVETESYLITAADGNTTKTNVPILRNLAFDSIKKQDWGEITLLVYKEGYVDFVLFFVMVRASQTRYLSNLMLFPTDSPDDNILHSIVESPDNTWAKELRDKYKVS